MIDKQKMMDCPNVIMPNQDNIEEILSIFWQTRVSRPLRVSDHSFGCMQFPRPTRTELFQGGIPWG